MAKAPSLQFYPGDVQRDTGLSSVSLQAFGLWHKMLWAMFDGYPYGHLSVNGSVIPPDNLARLLRVTLDELQAGLKELEEAKVYSKTTEGVIFCRRMVRDAKRRETNAINGSKGGNPRLSKSVKRKDIPQDIPLTAVAVSNTTISSNSGKERAGKVLFANSKYADPVAAAAELPDLRIDFAAYAAKIRNWSDAKDERRTDRGWLATYRTFHAKDQERNAPVKPEHSAERKDLKTTW